MAASGASNPIILNHSAISVLCVSSLVALSFGGACSRDRSGNAPANSFQTASGENTSTSSSSSEPSTTLSSPSAAPSGAALRTDATSGPFRVNGVFAGLAPIAFGEAPIAGMEYSSSYDFYGKAFQGNPADESTLRGYSYQSGRLVRILGNDAAIEYVFGDRTKPGLNMVSIKYVTPEACVALKSIGSRALFEEAAAPCRTWCVAFADDLVKHLGPPTSRVITDNYDGSRLEWKTKDVEVVSIQNLSAVIQFVMRPGTLAAPPS